MLRVLIQQKEVKQTHISTFTYDIHFLGIICLELERVNKNFMSSSILAYIQTSNPILITYASKLPNIIKCSIPSKSMKIPSLSLIAAAESAVLPFSENFFKL